MENHSIPELGTLLESAARHWFVCLVLGTLAAVVAAGAAWILTPSHFTATSYVRVRQREDYILRSPEPRVPDSAYVRNQERLVTMPQVMQAALQSVHLRPWLNQLPDEDPESWVRQRVDIEYPKSTEVMEISVAHEDSRLAQALANAVTEAFLEESHRADSDERSQRQAELERLLDASEQRLRDRWQELQSFAGKLGTGDATSLSIREQLQLETYRQYAQQLRDIRMQRVKVQRDLLDAKESLQRPHEAAVNNPALRRMIEENSELRRRLQELEQLESRIADFELVTRDEQHPQLQRLRHQRVLLSNQIDEWRAHLAERFRADAVSSLHSELQQRVVDLENRQEQLQQEEQFISQRLVELEDAVDRAGGENGVQLEMLRHEIEREEHITDTLWSSVATLRIEEQAKPRVSLINAAQLPTQRSVSKRRKMTLLAAPSALLMVVIGVGYLEFKTTRVRRSKDLVRRVGISVVDSEAQRSRWNAGRRKGHVVPTGIKNLAATLMYGPVSTRRCWMVTSATRQEGKEGLAIQLALSIARAGHKTLLVDLDLAAPSLHQRLGLPETPGVTSAIAGRRAAMDVTHATGARTLQVVPAGETVEDPFPVLSNNALAKLLETYRKNFDFIIINAPPTMSSGDAMVMSRCVDSALLATCRDVTRFEQARESVEHLKQCGVDVFAAAFRSADEDPAKFDISLADNSTILDSLGSGDVGDTDDVETALQRDLEDLKQDEQPW